jgi:hypothetical protein
MYVTFWRALAVVALPLLLGGLACQGYRTDALMPAEARRIAVPMFENDTFYRHIEFALTRDVTDVLRMRPGIYVVPEGEADVVLRGRVTRVSQSVLALGERDRIDERSATTTVKCRLVDRRTGDVVKDFDVSDRIDFATATGEGLGAAQHESFYDLARKIVFELEADW